MKSSKVKDSQGTSSWKMNRNLVILGPVKPLIIYRRWDTWESKSALKKTPIGWSKPKLQVANPID